MTNDTQTISNSNCKLCRYHGTLYDKGAMCCDYITRTGTRRPCKPGDLCEVGVTKSGEVIKPTVEAQKDEIFYLFCNLPEENKANVIAFMHALVDGTATTADEYIRRAAR